MNHQIMKNKKHTLFIALFVILGAVCAGVSFAIQAVRNGAGIPSLTVIWERMMDETPQAKASAYIKSVIDGDKDRALSAWKLRKFGQGEGDPTYNQTLLVQRREELTQKLIVMGIKDFEILSIEWWRTCCSPDVTLKPEDAGGARMSIRVSDKNGMNYRYIFDVFYIDTAYAGAAGGYRPRQWILRDVYQEGEEPLFWSMTSHQSIMYVSSYSSLRPGIDFRLDLPASWRGKYEVEENNDYSDFIYSGNPKQKYSLFKIHTIRKDKWERSKNESGYHGEELSSRADVVFVLTISLDNPFFGDYAEEYQKMAG